MLIPSLDIQNGKVVQLVGGEDEKFTSDDVFGWAEKLSVYGELAVVDLDAAKGTGDNFELVRALCRRFTCRVGGGVRDEARARALLKAGARRLMVGTAAEPELLQKLPRDVWIACLDHRDGVVTDRGWRHDTGERAIDRARRLVPYVGGFLVTNVNVEGSMRGPDADVAATIAEEFKLPTTAAGGVRNVEDIAALHNRTLDAQVGMAVYTGALDSAEAFVACLDFTRGADTLIPTFVTDERGRTLMLAWSSEESLKTALRERIGAYHSRSRNQLWRKGATSGHTQRLIRAQVDCDADALRFTVEQTGPACHTGAATCFGDGRFDLAALESHIEDRITREGYTSKLAGDQRLLSRKVMEEAFELVDAAGASERESIIHEAADLFFHALVMLKTNDISIRDIEAELAGRRRP
ncbi:MAG: phosphoribosyl-ATP diphosphatase [Phycisphaeraceae bacterium]|nr:MAG: phosphoribosyl-ATP diphosphatase [Phycisphaeraceae bacterium]